MSIGRNLKEKEGGKHEMDCIVLVLLAIVMLSGCTYSLPSNFVGKRQTDPGAFWWQKNGG